MPGMYRRGKFPVFLMSPNTIEGKGRPLVVMAGREYGTGSSRDWAAKGTNLQGVVAVVAQIL